MKHDLDEMRRNPSAVKRRDLVAALLERGWVIAREGKHQIWQRETVQVQVPQTLKSQWTVQSIVKQMIEAERD